MSDKAKFEIGDVVALKSGGDLMTVTRLVDGQVVCHHAPGWSAWYPPEAIEHASAARVCAAAPEVTPRELESVGAWFCELTVFTIDIRDSLGAGPEATLSDLARMASEQRVALLDAQKRIAELEAARSKSRANFEDMLGPDR